MVDRCDVCGCGWICEKIEEGATTMGHGG
jgi:hypothetical protein